MNKNIKRFLCLCFLVMLIGCSSQQEKISHTAQDMTSENGVSNEEEKTLEEEHEIMKLFINDIFVPVDWLDNDSTREIQADLEQGDIHVELSMYSNNEQVGSLPKKYTNHDEQTTTQNGDIVLYRSSDIVLFYGSNTWSYTRLGKMQLSSQEVIDLLSNGDVSITLKK